MFNYVVKDPDSSGLNREFWIKDQAASCIEIQGTPCVLELGCGGVCDRAAWRRTTALLVGAPHHLTLYSELSENIESSGACQELSFRKVQAATTSVFFAEATN